MLFAPAQAKQQPFVVLHGRDVGHAPVPELGANVAHASHVHGVVLHVVPHLYG